MPSFKETIQKYITYKITAKEWKPGDIIDSENKLSKKFNCSRLTARNAMIPLVNLGVIRSQKGKGYIVSTNSDEEFLHSTKKFLNATKTEVNVVDYDLKKYFDLKTGERYFQIEKKYFQKDKLVGYQITLLNRFHIWKMDLKELEKSITTFVAKQGGAIFSNQVQIYFDKLEILDNIAKKMHLDSNSYPIQKIISYSKETWIEKTLRILPKDKFKFTFTKYKY